MSWIYAARYVKENHACMLVNPASGALIVDKAQYDAINSVTEGDECDAPTLERKLKGVKGVLLDAVTANMLVTIYNALKPEQQSKFDAMELTKAVNIGWKLVAK